MYALIMAGGRASRMNKGEKALIQLAEQPLLSYVVKTISRSGFDPVIVSSPKTPYTTNYCRAHDLDLISCGGMGYVEDLIEAVITLDITGPFLTICADIPGINTDHISTVIQAYEKTNSEALSVWIPTSCHEKWGITPSLIMKDEEMNREISPAGVNILLGSKIQEEQREERIIIDDPILALNINTPEELIIAENFFRILKQH